MVFFQPNEPCKILWKWGYFLYFSNQMWSLRQYELQSNNTALALSLKHPLVTNSLDILDQLSGHSSSASMGGKKEKDHDLQLLSQLILMSTKDAESSNPAQLQMCHMRKLENLSTVKSTTQCCNRARTANPKQPLNWHDVISWYESQNKAMSIGYGTPYRSGS